MAVETSAVQIVINVTDANSGAVVAGVTQNLKQLGMAGAGAGAQVNGTSQSLRNLLMTGTMAAVTTHQAPPHTMLAPILCHAMGWL